jgi:hypothetical protein
MSVPFFQEPMHGPLAFEVSGAEIAPAVDVCTPKDWSGGRGWWVSEECSEPFDPTLFQTEKTCFLQKYADSFERGINPGNISGLKSSPDLVENWVWQPWQHQDGNKAAKGFTPCKPNYLGRTQAWQLLAAAGIKQIIFTGDSVMGGFIRTFTDFLGAETAEVRFCFALSTCTPSATPITIATPSNVTA